MDIVTLGLSVGMANALLAVGIVLIYKANRVINLAHGEFGAFCVAMMLWLVEEHHWNYWPALLVSLTSTGLLAAIVERTILARLWRSPRLILLIATLGIAQLIIVLRLAAFSGRSGSDQPRLTASFPVPFHFTPHTWDRVVIGPEHVTALIAGPLLVIGLGAFLRYSPYGIALRAAAENGPRARLLGIPVRRISTMAWVIAALFAGCAAVLLAPIIGFSATDAVGLPILMRGLAAATIARFESIGDAFMVGLALGVVDQLVFFWTGQSGLTDIVLLTIVVAVLLSLRVGPRRTIAAEESSWEMAEPVRPLPAEITSHARWQTLVSVTRAVIAAALLFAPFSLASSPTFFLASVFVLASVVIALTLLTGWAGQLSLGQWAIAGAGGIFGAKLVADWGLPFPVAFVGACVVGGVISLLLGLPALRLQGVELAVVTLGFAVTSASWLYEKKWFSPVEHFEVPGWLSNADVLYALCLGYLVLVVLAVRQLQRSRVGRNIVAIRDNPRHAASFGVPVARTKLTAFVVSGVLTAGAGFLWVIATGIPTVQSFPPARSLSLVSAAVIGGLGSIGGAILGALYFWAAPYFLSDVTVYIGFLATGVGLLVLLLFLPGGLSRVVATGRDHLARALTGIDPRPDVTPVSVDQTLEARPAPAARRQLVAVRDAAT